MVCQKQKKYLTVAVIMNDIQGEKLKIVDFMRKMIPQMKLYNCFSFEKKKINKFKYVKLLEMRFVKG